MYYNIITDDIEKIENIFHENGIEFYSTMNPMKFVVEEIIDDVCNSTDIHTQDYINAVEDNFSEIEEKLTPVLKNLFIQSSDTWENVYETIDEVIQPRVSYKNAK